MLVRSLTFLSGLRYLGGRIGGRGGIGRIGLVFGRDGARRQQAGEGYNGESVFQGKSILEMMG
jgi:hypothetical protein